MQNMSCIWVISKSYIASIVRFDSSSVYPTQVYTDDSGAIICVYLCEPYDIMKIEH